MLRGENIAIFTKNEAFKGKRFDGIKESVGFIYGSRPTAPDRS
jgi:hypothetical protein